MLVEMAERSVLCVARPARRSSTDGCRRLPGLSVQNNVRRDTMSIESPRHRRRERRRPSHSQRPHHRRSPRPGRRPRARRHRSRAGRRPARRGRPGPRRSRRGHPPADGLDRGAKLGSFSAPWNVDVKIAYEVGRAALALPLRPNSTVVIVSSGAGLNPNGSPLSGGYAGAKRMQMFLAGYLQRAADARELGSGRRRSPAQFLEGTRIGEGRGRRLRRRGRRVGRDLHKELARCRSTPPGSPAPSSRSPPARSTVRRHCWA